jgi:hypothetical protein
MISTEERSRYADHALQGDAHTAPNRKHEFLHTTIGYLVPNGITSSAVQTAFQQDLQQTFPAYRALKG